jgi:hypothetical protein
MGRIPCREAGLTMAERRSFGRAQAFALLMDMRGDPQDDNHVCLQVKGVATL